MRGFLHYDVGDLVTTAVTEIIMPTTKKVVFEDDQKDQNRGRAGNTEPNTVNTANDAAKNVPEQEQDQDAGDTAKIKCFQYQLGGGREEK